MFKSWPAGHMWSKHSSRVAQAEREKLRESQMVSNLPKKPSSRTDHECNILCSLATCPQCITCLPRSVISLLYGSKSLWTQREVFEVELCEDWKILQFEFCSCLCFPTFFLCFDPNFLATSRLLATETVRSNWFDATFTRPQYGSKIRKYRGLKTGWGCEFSRTIDIVSPASLTPFNPAQDNVSVRASVFKQTVLLTYY